MNSFIKTGLFAACLSVLAGFSQASVAADRKVVVGIMSGEEEEVWQTVAEVAAKQGLIVKTVSFNDYNLPNEALANGDLDANEFQHKPFLDNQIKVKGYEIVPVGYTAVWPIGLYSKKFRTPAELPQGAVIAIPNDPSNEGRALRLLELEGLIKLDPDKGILTTPQDITENVKGLKFKELDTGMLGRAIDDVDAAVINTDWALKASLSKKEKIASEPVENNPYRCFIAVRKGDANAPWVPTLVAAFQTEAVRDVILKVYGGAAVPAW
ncbi:MetQ/NlpA family ABC transporter substrate-binding protein [Pseudomonas sp. TB1-B1]|uniref:MetQ/NlpA family ABC transporter substrate-binding protein n=1 Tax=Pseudomonas sp. TB1-B1 TaxID=2985515 RepID=UPI00226FD9B9|nr:MetQ/NlpA family ABC transporter substrate-binding protein [Pseudomonas sp. TB1-B1]MCX9150247.1 MetQ/NlpA family ABC transporter substrate-binding protein [Pseudomonas sp. TB1-B1]